MINIAAGNRVPAAIGKAVTVSITTQTALANTVGFPSTYIAGSIAETLAGAANTFAATTTVGTTSLTIAVGSAGAAAAAYTVTLAGATMVSPIAENTLTGVSEENHR